MLEHTVKFTLLMFILVGISYVYSDQHYGLIVTMLSAILSTLLYKK